MPRVVTFFSVQTFTPFINFKQEKEHNLRSSLSLLHYLNEAWQYCALKITFTQEAKELPRVPLWTVVTAPLLWAHQILSSVYIPRDLQERENNLLLKIIVVKEMALKCTCRQSCRGTAWNPVGFLCVTWAPLALAPPGVPGWKSRPWSHTHPNPTPPSDQLSEGVAQKCVF